MGDVAKVIKENMSQMEDTTNRRYVSRQQGGWTRMMSGSK